MTYNERDTILKSVEFIGKVRIAENDWVNYWAVNGTESITDPDLRELTDNFLKLYLENPDAYVNKIATLVISESVIKESTEITDAIIETAITHLMSNVIGYLL